MLPVHGQAESLVTRLGFFVKVYVHRIVEFNYVCDRAL